MSETNNKTDGIATAVRAQSAAVFRTVLGRRYMILGVAGVLCVAAALYLLLPLIPRTAKPEQYRVGELSIEAITQAVGYRKVTAITQSMSGMGRAEAGTYTYRAGREPRADVETYYNLLMEQYGAQMLPESEIGEQDGTLLLTMPGTEPDRQITMQIAYDAQQYVVTVDEKPKLVEKEQPEFPANVTAEQARELLMTLTKADTGLKSDISVYTVNLEPDTVNVDGWDYYVFTVVADYSATRIEYRATFYVGCYDGVILNYDKDSGITSRLRGANGAVEEK